MLPCSSFLPFVLPVGGSVGRWVGRVGLQDFPIVMMRFRGPMIQSESVGRRKAQIYDPRGRNVFPGSSPFPPSLPPSPLSLLLTGPGWRGGVGQVAVEILFITPACVPASIQVAP